MLSFILLPFCDQMFFLSLPNADEAKFFLLLISAFDPGMTLPRNVNSFTFSTGASSTGISRMSLEITLHFAALIFRHAFSSSSVLNWSFSKSGR